MKLRDVMSPDVRCISPTSSIHDAALSMRELDVGALPVCDGDRLSGIVTDRDIVIRGLAAGPNDEAETVSQVMTPGVTWCFDTDSVETAASLMRERQIRRVPVLDSNKRLVGIVSLGDLAVRGNDDELSGQTLEVISESARTLAATD